MNRAPVRILAAVVLAILCLAGVSSSAPLVRVKDIAHLSGVRDNQLVGYGIIVGLQGTGDGARSGFTVLSVLSMLEKLGISLVDRLQQLGVSTDPKSIGSKNLAAVIVTATMPPFASNGQRLDITVSAIGDASSLEGGILLQAPLLGADGKVYAVAQGPVSLGGGTGGTGGRGGGGTLKTTGRIAAGAIVEREIVSDLVDADGNLSWLLNRPDFATASRLADAINKAYNPPIARAETAEKVKVLLPSNHRQNPVAFIARIEDLLLQPDEAAKVVINERTGTIVFGEYVRISTVAISHGNLSVSIKDEAANDEIRENTLTLPEGTNVKDLVRTLNAIGVTPRDTIAILQAISRSGALHAELEFI